MHLVSDLIKRCTSAVLAGLIMLICTQNVQASSFEVQKTVTLNDTNADSAVTMGLDDLEIQLNDLYQEVGNYFKIDYLKVKIIHLVAGGKAIYADKRPNIYIDTTVDNGIGPMDIKGATQVYDKKAPWAYCPDPKVERPSKYYMPDAIYNVTSDIVKLMNKRLEVDRGDLQSYFDELKNDVKANIIFYEAILEYSGIKEAEIGKIYYIYEKLLYDKDMYENVLEADEHGIFEFKSKFKEIFIDNGVTSDKELNTLAIMLSFDKNLAANNDPELMKETIELPYKVGYTSRENMMIAASSVVGKVRYVWGGGHLSTGSIEGINPLWAQFDAQYDSDETGQFMCIKPGNSWCPIHGVTNSEDGNGCLFSSPVVYKLESYVDSHSYLDNTELLLTNKFKKVMVEASLMEHGLNSHRFDGLDCSGYTGWVMNQIDQNNPYDSGARSFLGQAGVQKVEYGSALLPGDLYSWGEHIVIVVGKVKDNSSAYVILEASPNTVKYGVMYYSNAAYLDIEYGYKIAKEANELFGDIDETERTNRYNIDNLGYYTLEVENTTENDTDQTEETDDEANTDESLVRAIGDEEYRVIRMENEIIPLDSATLRYAEFGRLKRNFIDDDTIVSKYNKSIKNMVALDIIQHTIDRIGSEYLTGFESYSGELFDVSKYSINKKAILENGEDSKTEIEENVEILKISEKVA